MNRLTLSLSRMMRAVHRDINLPMRCNAVYYKIHPKTICDCKIWCKFPPPGNYANVAIQENSLKNQEIYVSKKHGSPQLYSRH